ncbi:MAG: glycosyl hydrolase [Rhodocyclaceae bacterium]|nr:MAG: glycosyl hydrolase [Rhodocyclaceae bacterium]
MLKSLGKFEKSARLVVTIVTSLIPFSIVGGLLYAALFVKAEAMVSAVKPPAIERRDRFMGVAMPSDKVIWAAGSNGKVIRSDDGGATWAAQTAPTQENLQGLAAWSADQAVAVGGDGVVIRTADGGKTWAPVQVPKSEVANKLLNVRNTDNGTAWAVGEMGAVLKTADFGQTWTRVLPEKDQAWNDISFHGEHGIMVGEFGQIQTTADGGKNWKPVSSGVKSSLMSVYLRDSENGVAVGLSGVVLVTRDGGAQWKEVAQLTREHLNDVIWDGSQWVAVGDKGVMVTGGDAGWKATRVSEGNLGWNTQVLGHSLGDKGKGYVLAGASLAHLDNGTLSVFGRAAD